MENLPLISCLCVTRNKVELIARAITCFKSQTYQNKELVIVYEDNDPDIKNFVTGIKDPTIKSFEISTNPKLSLGELRNLSLEFAIGEYICQWDADDWYHNRRLELQMDYCLKMHKPVCFLTYWLIFDSLTRKAYLSCKRLWEGTILCRKDRIKQEDIKYPAEPKMEDFYFVEKLLEKNHVYPVDLPHLYIYVYHGENTWPYQHFQHNFEVGKVLSESASQIINDILEGKYSNGQASDLLDSAAILEEIEYDYQF